MINRLHKCTKVIPTFTLKIIILAFKKASM
jgi:hypothetical protein